MNRLTMMDSQGNWRLKGVEWRQLQEGEIITRHMAEKLYGALYKLKAYEDTGLTPEKIVEMDMLYAEKCKELAERSNGWIPCSERLPEEKINPITDDFYMYPVMYKNVDVSDIKYFHFGKGHWYHGFKIMDEYVTHWMDIKPYQPKGE